MVFKKGHMPWSKGRHLSNTHKMNISRANKGNTCGPKGKSPSKIHKRKLSEAHRGQVSWLKGLTKETDERVKRFAEKLRGRKLSEKTRDKVRKARLTRVFPVKDTFIEVAMQNELARREIIYAKHVPVCGVCQPDIVFPEKKIAVFCDGDYWHNLPNRKLMDRRIDETLRRNDWVVYRFWEHEINSDVKACVDKIQTGGKQD